MNFETVQWKWSQMTWYMKEKWWELTNDDLQEIDWRKDILIWKLQEKYWWTKEKAEEELDNFLNNFE